MGIRQYVVDAFASEIFKGNPAAVCPLESWPDDVILQSIAAENNLSETAFFVSSNDGYQLRWFTPVDEVDLCGHATLASAHVLFHHLGVRKDEIRFHTRSGELTVRRCSELLEMTFPASRPKPCPAPDGLLRGLGGNPVEVLSAEDYLVVYPSGSSVRSLKPAFRLLSGLQLRGVIVTAVGDQIDFVSRFFAPKLGIDEDPVTGSAHCQLVPYWADRLKKPSLRALQVSKRSGEVLCKLRGDKVLISGRAMTYSQGELLVEL